MARNNWSTGRELNPRILILQTSALATSPPVLILPPTEGIGSRASYKLFPNAKNPTRLGERVGNLSLDSNLLNLSLNAHARFSA